MGRASEGKVFLGKDSREPLSRIVWLTETKIRRRYFFYPRGGNVGGKGGGGWHGWIPCVPARTKDKRRRRRRLSFVSSVICLAVVVVPPPFHPEPFPAARGRVRGPAGGKDAGDMGLHG